MGAILEKGQYACVLYKLYFYEKSLARTIFTEVTIIVGTKAFNSLKCKCNMNEIEKWNGQRNYPFQSGTSNVNGRAGSNYKVLWNTQKKWKLAQHINSKMIIITAFVRAIIFGINAGRGPNGTFYGLPIVIFTLTLVISTRTRLTS